MSFGLLGRVWHIVVRRIGLFFGSSIYDVFKLHIILLPWMSMIIGIFHPQIWIQAFSLFLVYVITFVTIFTLLIFLWTPVFLPISVIFGPAGPLTYILTLYTNTQLITTMILNSHIATPLFDNVLSSVLGLPIARRTMKTNFVEPREVNANEVLSAIRMILASISLILLVAIPLIGPLILTFVMSVKVSYDNFERYLILRGVPAVKRRDFYYQHLIQFIYYGGSEAVASLLPVVSVWATVCYPLGVSMWGASNASLVVVD